MGPYEGWGNSGVHLRLHTPVSPSWPRKTGEAALRFVARSSGSVETDRIETGPGKALVTECNGACARVLRT